MNQKTLGRRIASCGAFACLGLSAAQAASPPEPAIHVEHESVLRDYVKYQDEPIQPWAASNDAVREAGGWRALAKERERAQTNGPAPQPPAGNQQAGTAEAPSETRP